MASLNKVQLIGNAGDDPELKYFQGGDAVCNITIATSESWKDKETGERKERTEWHKLVLHRHLAEIADKYVKKGSSIYVEGKLRTRKWKDRDGADRYTTEVVVDELQVLANRKTGDSQPGDRGNPADASRRGYQRPSDEAPHPKGRGTPTFDDLGQDIPF